MFLFSSDDVAESHKLTLSFASVVGHTYELSQTTDNNNMIFEITDAAASGRIREAHESYCIFLHRSLSL